MSMDENYKIDLDETIKMFTNQSTSRENQLTEKKKCTSKSGASKETLDLKQALDQFRKSDLNYKNQLTE